MSEHETDVYGDGSDGPFLATFRMFATHDGPKAVVNGERAVMDATFAVIAGQLPTQAHLGAMAKTLLTVAVDSGFSAEPRLLTKKEFVECVLNTEYPDNQVTSKGEFRCGWTRQRV